MSCDVSDAGLVGGCSKVIEILACGRLSCNCAAGALAGGVWAVRGRAGHASNAAAAHGLPEGLHAAAAAAAAHGGHRACPRGSGEDPSSTPLPDRPSSHSSQIISLLALESCMRLQACMQTASTDKAQTACSNRLPVSVATWCILLPRAGGCNNWEGR